MLKPSLVLALGLGLSPWLAAQDFRVQKLVETGTTLTSISNLVAINDSGVVAFSGREAAGSAGYTSAGGNLATRVTFSPNSRRLFSGAAISSASTPLVAMRDRVSGSPPVWLVRAWAPSGVGTILGRSGAGRDFDSASFHMHINSGGVTTFSGLVGGSTQTALFSSVGGTGPVTLATFPGVTSFRPQISDDDRIIIRDPQGRIAVYQHPSGAVELVTDNSWTSVGPEPGISRDGRALAWIGDDGNGAGEQVYVGFEVGGARIVESVVRSGFFTDIEQNQRVGVQSVGSGDSDQRIDLVYVATRDQSGTPVTGVYLQSVRVQNTTTGLVIQAEDPRKVVGVGDTVDGSQVSSLRLYHPLNRACQVGISAGFSNGASGVLRADSKVRADRPNMRIRSFVANQTSTQPSVWDLEVEMDNDNGNAALQNTRPTWRRWWHFEVCDIDTLGETLNVRVTNAGYSDTILPVVSTSPDFGETWSDYVRANQIDPNIESTYSVQSAGTEHRFTLEVPAGVTQIRLAKYFPYTIEMKDDFIDSIEGNPAVQVDRSQVSEEGRMIERLTITNHAVPDAGKYRVWIHAGVHPTETTSYFTVEGLVEELLSGTPEYRSLLRNVVFNIIPMVNPDGVRRGNYRTNAFSLNLEDQWGGNGMLGARTAETRAMKQWIDQFMGTRTSPGETPIDLMFNLHSSHNLAFPFHFVHCAEGTPSCSPGVRPGVRQRELEWVQAFRARSAFVDLGTDGASVANFGTIEQFMNSTYSDRPEWEDVMAITFEGTYGQGPITFPASMWNTAQDYMDVGREMAQAICDTYSGGTFREFGAGCGGVSLSGSYTFPLQLDLDIASPFSNAPAVLFLSNQRAAPGLPLSGGPGSAFAPGCVLHLATLPITAPLTTNGQGNGTRSFPIFSTPLNLDVQAFVLDGTANLIYGSNGLVTSFK